MSDKIFDNYDKKLKAIKIIGNTKTPYGEYVKLPCDNIRTWYGFESCLPCTKLKQCEESEEIVVKNDFSQEE